MADNAQQIKNDKRHEKEAGFGGILAGGAALYEKHEAKKNPVEARKHQIEATVAAGGAVGAEALAFYEHHEKKKLTKDGKEVKPTL